MNRLAVVQTLPETYSRSQVVRVLQQLETLLNASASGQIAGSVNATTAPPTGTAESYQIGDVVRNTAPAELGSAGSKYVILGWIAVTAGAPGTWKELRCLTGG